MITSIENIWMRGSLLALALALALGACGDDDGGGDNEETPADTGTKPNTDAAVKDATVGLDAAVDAATPKPDATTPTDAAIAPDARVADAATDAGADAGVDSSTPVAIPTLNGCAAANYEDKSATADTREVKFGGSLQNTYSPKCLTIAAGQKVTFTGTFSQHPLAKGTASDANAGSAGNPITDTTNTGTSKEITYPTAGTYPYNCTFHKNAGMVGSIHVK